MASVSSDLVEPTARATPAPLNPQQLTELLSRSGTAALFQQLRQDLLARRDYHRLFDLRLLEQKQAWGLSLLRPTSFDDVPADQRDAFEQTYLSAAREVGELLLADHQFSAAHMYFQAIRDTSPLLSAIEAAEIPAQSTPQSEELIEVALFKGVAPVKGVQTMLRTHGVCNTITALDQQFGQLRTHDRRQCAAQLVRRLHADLLTNVQNEVRQRLPLVPAGKSLRELVADRDWLFADGNYHIDVSHLNSTVRFARGLTADDPELRLALDLTEYGERLAPQYQYPGDPPFEEPYTAHKQFFRVLLDDEREAGLAFFRSRLETADDSDRALVAYVLVDLLVRIGRLPEAVDLAREHLVGRDEEFLPMFAELCQQAGLQQTWQQVAAERGDIVSLAAALLSPTAAAPSAAGVGTTHPDAATQRGTAG